ncbi:MAG: thiamine biosynthesis protein ThiS [Candidatus Omnitrophica bacterium CG1_02_49_16]|nr:MAG: thiamine biosynthesis protein ThiS [Candidatus Omnitrophica bacterium CG1_02_49_16]
MSSTDSVKIILNGKPARIKPGLTVSDLLIQRRMRAELVTVELDGTILQKLDYDTTQIKEGDKVEFVFYMGGGDLKS